ncbi:MAG: ligase-associated DNA damage response DEXH box helicase [Planctomycetota bacterium]|nr:ligase-associated DNA damage response DEXH box helicase [Planctomycetota bacterium]
MMTGSERALEYFQSKGRSPFDFQTETWRHYGAGKSGLLQAPTGTGKTLAAALGPMIEWLDTHPVRKNDPIKKQKRNESAPLALLWITPLRALAADTAESLQPVIDALQLPCTIELRTADTTAAVRKKQRDRLPTVLITTPESLSLLLSYPGTIERFANLKCVVVDEWHELIASKRGVQTELGLARLRKLSPSLRIWGLSATLANPRQALATLVGPTSAQEARIITAPDDKSIEIESILPNQIDRFPWAGHLGTRMVDDVIRKIESARTTLVFTNTRSQSELWFRALLQARPDWIGLIGLHHGSIDRKLRHAVEDLLRQDKLKAAVCTSSLDLGVDFWPVDQVIQIGSPKSVARAMQRAGRSGHQPGAASRLVCLPTQAFELIEFSAARHAIQARNLESRDPIRLALDVLAQHIITLAAGDGFDATELLNEVRTTSAYAELTDQQWQWVLDFAHRGGASLKAYPRFGRIHEVEPGKWAVASDALARAHRTNIGTIASDGAVAIQFMKGRRLGSVEESFVARLKPGDTFVFSGRTLEFRRVHDMVAHVRLSRSRKGAIPRWMGGRLPLSESLAIEVCHRLDQAAHGIYADAEMQKVKPLLELQALWSAIPQLGEMLIETTTTREGDHHYIYPFLGRLVHEGLAALLAFRLGMRGHKPITASFNDYGIELLSPAPMNLSEEDYRSLLSPQSLLQDTLDALNSGELARRHFREIARIAGLLVPARPGGFKSTRQLQASSGLFYDVFAEFDPENLLLIQARTEVLERHMEFARLKSALIHMSEKKFVLMQPRRLSPLAFPLWAERIASQQLRLESATQRIERLAQQLERAADYEPDLKQKAHA